MFFTYYTADDMRKLIVFTIHIIVAVYLTQAEAIDWSENYFPFDTAAMGTGGTFTRTVFSQRLSPALSENDEYAASTAFLPDINVYYFAVSKYDITADLFYYRWGKEDWRDENGALLGDFYASDYSFSLGYTRTFGIFRPALQIRYQVKEIGNTQFTVWKIAPSCVVSYKNILAGASWLDPAANIISVFGSYDAQYAELSARVDYDEDIIAGFGAKIFLTQSRIASVSLGMNDGHLTSGLILTNSALSFSYGVSFIEEGFTVHNFGLHYRLRGEQ